jgi:O-antigen/teichoic acid export membrane protein
MNPRLKSFLGGVAYLTTGHSIARAIPLLALPFLTRLYTPEDFAGLGVFLAVATILNSISSGGYEFGIVVARRDWQASSLFWLSVTLSVVLSGVFFVGLSIAERVSSNTFTHSISLPVLLPFMVITNTSLEALRQVSIRYSRYSVISHSVILNNFVSVLGQLTISQVVGGANGLIIGSFMGQVSAVVYLGIRSPSLTTQQIRRILRTAIAYRDYPSLRLPSNLLNRVISEAPVLILRIFVSETIIGYYFMGKKLAGTPVTLLGRSIGRVFRGQFAKDYNQGVSSKSTYLQTFAILVGLSVAIFGTIAATISLWIGPVLGSEWVPAIPIIQILTIRFAAAFVSSPLSGVYDITRKLHLNLLYQFTYGVVAVGGFYLSFLLTEWPSPLWVFSLASVFMSVLYVYIGSAISSFRPQKTTR